MQRINILFLVIVACFGLTCCQDNEPLVKILDVYPKMGTAESMVIINGVGFSSKVDKNTVKFNGVEAQILQANPSHLIVKVPQSTTGKIEVSSQGKTVETEYLFEIFESKGIWHEKNSFPGSYRFGALSFSTDENGFVGLGSDSDLRDLKDIWKYNPSNDTWTRLNDFPGYKSFVHSSFVIESKVFVLVDSARNYFDFNPELWEYEIESDTWTKTETTAADITGGDPYPYYSVYASVSYQSKGIVGIITDYYDGSSGYSNFKEYDPVSGEWENIITNGYGGERNYLATLASSAIHFISFDSLRRFDIPTAEWSAEVIPSINILFDGFSFSSSNGNLYFGLGSYLEVEFNNVWGYSLSTHTWFPVSPSPFMRRSYFRGSMCNFTVNNKCYFIFGEDENGPTNKVIEFEPEL